MKICILVRVLWPGGVQRIAFAEAEGLTKLGNNVDLIFIRGTKKYTYSENINYKVLYENNINKRILGRIFRKITLHYLPQRGEDATVDMDLIYKAEHNLKNKYDIIYYFDEFSAFFQKYNKKKYGNKTAVLIHEVALFNRSKLSKFVQKRAIKNSDIVLTNTKENLDLLKKFGIKNAYEVYPGLILHNDIPDFDSRGNIAVSVTMWDFGRKPEILLKIAKKLKYGKIVIAGSWADNKYLEDFKKMVSDDNLNDKLIVTGPIEETDLVNLYKKAKVSIRFGYNEKGPGMGSLESIAWGIPLIINKGIGIKEIIKNNVNGYIVNENDYEIIANLIGELFNKKDTWSEISKNNIILAKDLSWDNHCLKFNSIFQKLLNK